MISTVAATIQISIAPVFLLAGIAEGVQPMLDSPAAMEDDDEKLSDTPFSAMPDPEVSDVPSRGERTNVYFVVVASDGSRSLRQRLGRWWFRRRTARCSR